MPVSSYDDERAKTPIPGGDQKHPFTTCCTSRTNHMTPSLPCNNNPWPPLTKHIQ